MALLLHIETSSPACSVAVSDGGKLLHSIHSVNENEHAAQLAPIIKQILHDSSISFTSLKAVSVSAGPGSYTGLRIGVSTAKGICHALQIPLITLPTLEMMAMRMIDSKQSTAYYYCPMIDARRMEVYYAVFNQEATCCISENAHIIDEHFLLHLLHEKTVLFFGSGAAKCNPVITHGNAQFYNDFKMSAENLVGPATQRYDQKQFADLAYFEPNYIKSFYTKSSPI